jgi:hypothetical protein
MMIMRLVKLKKWGSWEQGKGKSRLGIVDF